MKSNHLLIAMWIFLVLVISGGFAAKLGARYLFLDPEYLGNVDFWSFLFLGMAFGCFFITWNLTTYLLSSHHFPFLASLHNPFTKFCLNNLLLPFSFFLFFLIAVIRFQGGFGEVPAGDVFLFCLGFFTGFMMLILLFFIYFHYTNKDITHYHKSDEQPPNLTKSIKPGRRDVDLEYIKMDSSRWKVKTYFNESFQLRLVRSVAHYDSKLLMRIFKQNHLNALIIQLFTIVVLMLLGLLTDFKLFRIPAGASIFFLLSIVIAIIGALTYWLNEWRGTVIILLLLFINFVTSFEIGNHKNKAYGLDYEGTPAEYTYERMQTVSTLQHVERDKIQMEGILDNWKKKVTTDQNQKPKMVILCVSGGGLRSAIWTLQVVQKVDSILKGGFLDHTVLITGASGGMIGMSYLRELKLRQVQGADFSVHDPNNIDNISKDLLNSVAFTLVANDLFLPWTKFKYKDKRYYKDRGYIFEEQLNENTGGILDKSLSDYRLPEQEALIPMLFITPSIVNDGRRMIISPHGVSFMTIAPVGVENKNTVEVDAVDFMSFFKQQDADSLRFLTALRMNATYPYILPNVHLPSSPEIEIMDAGFRDNYGLLSATRFIQVFKPWIEENTSGVVLVQISSSRKIEEIHASDRKGAIASLLNPLEIAGQILSLQEFEQDNSLGFIYDLLGKKQFHLIRFMYHPGRDNKIMASISFHITDRERKVVLDEFKESDNQASLQQLIQLMQESHEQKEGKEHLLSKAKK